MNRRLVLGAGLVAVLTVGFWMFRPATRPPEFAFVGEGGVSLWSRLAQVREPVASLHYGDRVVVLERRKGQVLVRTSRDEQGWLDDRNLIEPTLWRQAVAIEAGARSLPVQSRGRTRVLTNVRVEPGRSAPRIYQFGRDVRVEVLARTAVKAPMSEGDRAPDTKDTASPLAHGEAESAATDSSKPREEDWYLVRSHVPGVGPLTGWVLARFLEMDYPEPLHDLGAGIRFQAWFELNRVTDYDGEKPQYLAAGVIGPEGQPCDFTLFRVYTWSLARHRYETAYVESKLCGRLPIAVASDAETPVPPGTRFRFTAVGQRGKEQREYLFRQNIVRRLRTPAG